MVAFVNLSGWSLDGTFVKKVVVPSVTDYQTFLVANKTCVAFHEDWATYEDLG